MAAKRVGKGARTNNFTNEQRELLLELIETRITVIEDKRIDGDANKKKGQAWKVILNEFSTRFPGRNLTQLKDLWKRMKIAAKKEVSEHKRWSNGTGGGPPPPPLSDITIKIQELVPGEFIQMINEYDDDADGSAERGENDGNDRPTTSNTRSRSTDSPTLSCNESLTDGELEEDSQSRPSSRIFRPISTSEDSVRISPTQLTVTAR